MRPQAGRLGQVRVKACLENVEEFSVNRIHNLDYLRGLAAFGIMIYHYLSWTIGIFPADTFLGRLGLYGVSIFYVLSGLTLCHVYYDRMKPSVDDLVLFFKKRVLRIFPLLWLVTITMILLLGKTPNPINLFLNLSGLFGFVRWDIYYSPGVWSIGNELVFYVFFPFSILFIKKSKPLMVLLSLAIFGLYLYFAFVKLDPNITLERQWKDYINPLNQVFLFLGGFLLGFFLQDVKIDNSIIVVMLLATFALFTWYPSAENPIDIVTGSSRLVFTICCFLICLCFYKLTYIFPKVIHQPLTLLGEASYSVYLLHPIVYTVMDKASDKLNGVFYVPISAVLFLSILLTLVFSYFVYQYFEKYFMAFGRRRVVSSGRLSN
jgi:exopolysaccharide production protein ExoZ